MDNIITNKCELPDKLVDKVKLLDKLIDGIREFHKNYPNLYVNNIDTNYLISKTGRKELIGLDLDIRLRSSSKQTNNKSKPNNNKKGNK